MKTAHSSIAKMGGGYSPS